MNSKNTKLLWTAAGFGALLALNALRKKPRNFSFKDKVVIITGGSRGLGLVLARQFAKEGALLALCARDEEELDKARKDLEERGAKNVIDVVCDVTKQEIVNEMVQNVRAYYGRIDALINNAGIIQVGPIEVQTIEDFEQAMDVHFWGPLYTMLAILPEMQERKTGRIINIASIGGKISVPHLAPYNASKFALVGLSSALRNELVKDNVFVTTVCPGLMRTGSHINAVFKGQNKAEFAWFSISDSLPFISTNAERAANQIISASKRGDAELVITLPAQLAVVAHALLPELTAEILSLTNRLLPSAGGIGTNHALGKESASAFAPSILTALADKASLKNNELSYKDIYVEALRG